MSFFLLFSILSKAYLSSVNWSKKIVTHHYCIRFNPKLSLFLKLICVFFFWDYEWRNSVSWWCVCSQILISSKSFSFPLEKKKTNCSQKRTYYVFCEKGFFNRNSGFCALITNFNKSFYLQLISILGRFSRTSPST